MPHGGRGEERLPVRRVPAARHLQLAARSQRGVELHRGARRRGRGCGRGGGGPGQGEQENINRSIDQNKPILKILIVPNIPTVQSIVFIVLSKFLIWFTSQKK